jgi:lipopolysaccharide export system protein LptA
MVITKDGAKTMTADTLFYNRATGFGEAFSHLELNDTTQKILITGNYGYYDQKTEYAFATDSAQFIEYSQIDTLYMHADTLQMQTVGEEREIKAFHGVRIYRVDMQGVADSLQFNTADSTLYLYQNPILWNTGYQITGDTIQILFNDSTIQRFKAIDRVFVLEEIDSTYYNQTKGKLLTAYFDAGELNIVDIEGNTESIYYNIQEKGAEVLQLNKVESMYATIIIAERKPVRIKWFPEWKGMIIPIPDLKPEEKLLKGYVNYDYLRPKNKEDIFTQIQIK